MMCFASSTRGCSGSALSVFSVSSVRPDAGDCAGERGGKPDLESSPDVFTCSRIFKGVDSRSGGSALFTASAALIEDIVCIE